MSRLSADERGRAIGLIKAGVPESNVTRLLNCSREAIFNLQIRYRDAREDNQPNKIREATDYYPWTVSVYPRHLSERQVPGRLAYNQKHTRTPTSGHTDSYSSAPVTWHKDERASTADRITSPTQTDSLAMG
ncbi:hypothetical protein PoB_004711200 [Plakobranchus ocellatus]|uniref:Paired domain-containing protein n=1 Tax=Plakobranchus ocellatus TaxID=259542 RepID=A0AAV4BMH7_9GAST|nr:hypothetical protein PoB_004711200 [Plakobranchus ocellatus]